MTIDSIAEDQPATEIASAAVCRSIARWRENLIDSEIVVSDACRDLHTSRDRFRVAERECNRIADHLAQLIALADRSAQHREAS